MARYVVARVGEIPPGTRKIVEAGHRSIGIFNVQGTFYALRNACPHQGAPLCTGRIIGLTVSDEPGESHYEREGEIIRCPWHGWEFDICTGRAIVDPTHTRVRSYQVTLEPPSVETYPVTVEDELVVVHV